MSKRVAASDTAIIARGLLLLLTVIVIGVGVAEHQLATLTERLEQPRFFYIGSNQEHVYTAYVFGHGLTLGKAPWGNIQPVQRSSAISFPDYMARIAHRVEVEGLRVQCWLDVWQQQFRAEAFAAKNKIHEYWQQAKPYLEISYQKTRSKLETVRQQIAEFVRE